MKGVCTVKKYLDHTSEVETRILAIRIFPRDTCSFFKQRPNALAMLKECWYCVYSEFENDSSDINQQGFCKFKK